MPDDNLRQRLSDPPVRILNRLPVSGKLMIVAENDGVTHERIGTIDRRESQSGRLFCIGSAHNCSIESVVIDRVARMKDGVLPKIEFQNSAEETRFTVVSLDNSDKFDAGFASFSVPVAVPHKQLSEASQHSDDDPAFQPLRAAMRPGSRSKFKCAGRHWTSAGAEKSRRSILRWASST
jgi:hypothetical protein